MRCASVAAASRSKLRRRRTAAAPRTAPALDWSRPPTARAARRRLRAAACWPWRRRRAGGGVRHGVSPVSWRGAGRGAGPARHRRRRRERQRCRRRARRLRRQHRRLVDRQQHARRRLRVLLRRADDVVAVERQLGCARRRRASPPGAGRPSGWCALRVRLSLRNSAPSSGMSPSSGTLDLLVGEAVFDQAAEHEDRRRRRPPRSTRSSACRSTGRRWRCRARPAG